MSVVLLKEESQSDSDWGRSSAKVQLCFAVFVDGLKDERS
jgi:hypothetical protein